MAVALAVFLIAYSSLLNLWGPFNGPLYLPFNLTLVAILGLLARGPFDLTRAELGLAEPIVTGALMGAGLALVVVVPLFVAARSPRWRHRIADRRVIHLRGGALAYQVLLRIPLGTALLEEFAFRGVLYGLLAPQGEVRAALLSSLVFGLWHVSPTLNLVRSNQPDATHARTALTIAGAIVVTTVAGLLLVWFRVRFGLACPLALHAVVNSLATLAAVVAGRRSGLVLEEKTSAERA